MKEMWSFYFILVENLFNDGLSPKQKMNIGLYEDIYFHFSAFSHHLPVHFSTRFPEIALISHP
jgi:hypothetical protein